MTDMTNAIKLILERHPNGAQLVAGLVGPGRKHSEAQQAVVRAMYWDEVVLGADGLLYAPA